MKGIILAGGQGTRLYPMTIVTSKQLQPIYDKPMIYYSISFLMLAGVKEFLIISTEYDTPFFKKLLGDGHSLGINISYEVQHKPTGLPEAFIIGEKFIGNDDVQLILGDNLFYGDMSFYRKALTDFTNRKSKELGQIFAYSVSDPSRYGVVEFEKGTTKVVSLEEKPSKPKSHFAIPGLYVFDSSVVRRSKSLKVSARGETEITDLMKSYFDENLLNVRQITRGVAWLDTGTPKSLLEASSYVGAIEERQGLKIACLEEVAMRMGYIDIGQYKNLLSELPSSPYKTYLEKLLLEEFS